jgi:hypothetical protein
VPQGATSLGICILTRRFVTHRNDFKMSHRSDPAPRSEQTDMRPMCERHSRNRTVLQRLHNLPVPSHNLLIRLRRLQRLRSVWLKRNGVYPISSARLDRSHFLQKRSISHTFPIAVEYEIELKTFASSSDNYPRRRQHLILSNTIRNVLPRG